MFQLYQLKGFLLTRIGCECWVVVKRHNLFHQQSSDYQLKFISSPVCVRLRPSPHRIHSCCWILHAPFQCRRDLSSVYSGYFVWTELRSLVADQYGCWAHVRGILSSLRGVPPQNQIRLKLHLISLLLLSTTCAAMIMLCVCSNHKMLSVQIAHKIICPPYQRH
jgi:hypothetical protein